MESVSPCLAVAAQHLWQPDQADAERRQCPDGERTGKRFRLADRMKVKLVRVDLESRKIDFVPV